MTTTQWPWVGDFYTYESAHRKETTRRIKEHRDEIKAEADRFGNDILAARRRLGIPDPDQKEFGQAMLQFQIGLRALAQGMYTPGFTIEGVPTALRKWLSNPIEGTPATDDELAMYVDMLRKRQALAEDAA